MELYQLKKKTAEHENKLKQQNVCRKIIHSQEDHNFYSTVCVCVWTVDSV